jgi:chemotaxis signal transduction protein
VGPSKDGSSGERALIFELGDRCYALRLATVDGLSEPGPVRRVHDAPHGVLGLAEWRGRLVTVLDLGALLGAGPIDGPASLVGLASPLAHAALHVPAAIRIGRVTGSGDGREARKPLPGNGAPDLIDPFALVQRVAARAGC